MAWQKDLEVEAGMAWRRGLGAAEMWIAVEKKEDKRGVYDMWGQLAL